MRKEKSLIVTIIAVLVKYKKYISFFKKYISMMIKMIQSRETDCFSETTLKRLLKMPLRSFMSFVFTFAITFFSKLWVSSTSLGF